MARKTIGDKPRDIRDATIAEVVAVGSTAISVNKVAQRAGLSVGTIYRYHRSKDDLLFAVFLDVKRDIHATMMEAASEHVGAEARLKAMWFALVEYGFQAPGDFKIAELMGSETRAQFHGNEELKQIQAEVLGEIQSGIDDGTLVNENVRIIETVLASPAITLARRVSLRGEYADPEEVERIFALTWRGIAVRPSSYKPK